MKQISDIGKEMLAFQKKLGNEYGYKPIEYNLFLGDVREKYRLSLPEWCELSGNFNVPLFSLDGTQISSGYNRIVIGDYGAFVEISSENIIKDNIFCKPGQEWRNSDESFAQNIKYLWLTTKDNSNCKIYFQKKKVTYADYIPGMYYISPYEIDQDKIEQFLAFSEKTEVKPSFDTLINNTEQKKAQMNEPKNKDNRKDTVERI